MGHIMLATGWRSLQCVAACFERRFRPRLPTKSQRAPCPASGKKPRHQQQQQQMMIRRTHPLRSWLHTRSRGLRCMQGDPRSRQLTHAHPNSIARNRQRLIELGVLDAVNDLKAIAPPPQPAKKRAAKCESSTRGLTNATLLPQTQAPSRQSCSCRAHPAVRTSGRAAHSTLR